MQDVVSRDVRHVANETSAYSLVDDEAVESGDDNEEASDGHHDSYKVVASGDEYDYDDPFM